MSRLVHGRAGTTYQYRTRIRGSEQGLFALFGSSCRRHIQEEWEYFCVFQMIVNILIII